MQPPNSQQNFFETYSDNNSPVVSYNQIQGKRDAIRIIDLFSGIGGFHYGVEAAAAAYKKPVDAVIVSEIEESCNEVYRKNFNCDISGDINKIPIHDYTNIEIDFLTAGFPCQPFSNSGKKLGLSDPRGQFYERIESFIRHFNPKAFILENVPGIKNNGGGCYVSKLGNSKTRIGKTLSILEDRLLMLENYNIKWVELNSSEFGSPQVRRRVFIIGLHKDYGEHLNLIFPKFKKNPFISVVSEQYQKEFELSKSQENNIRSFMDTHPSYNNGMRRVGQAYLCKGGNVGQAYHAYGLVPTITKVWARMLPIYFPDVKENYPLIGEKKYIPNKHYGSGYLRKASVSELAAIQGFPVFFHPHPKTGIAAAHLGNSVNVKVVSEIAHLLLKRILSSK